MNENSDVTPSGRAIRRLRAARLLLGWWVSFRKSRLSGPDPRPSRRGVLVRSLHQTIRRWVIKPPAAPFFTFRWHNFAINVTFLFGRDSHGYLPCFRKSERLQ